MRVEAPSWVAKPVPRPRHIQPRHSGPLWARHGLQRLDPLAPPEAGGEHSRARSNATRTAPLESQQWRECEQRRAPFVVVNLTRGRYLRVDCDLLPADVSHMSSEQQEPLQWLVRSFTAIGGEFWYGVSSGCDRFPRDRAAEFAVRLGALGAGDDGGSARGLVGDRGSGP
jgi:hypothetical protein